MEFKKNILLEQIRSEIDILPHYLKTDKPDKSTLFKYLRNSTLLFIPCYYKDLSRKEIFELNFEFIFILGQYNLPIALGFCMNQYILSSVATCPLNFEDPLNDTRKNFLQMILDNRWIVAVSSFDEQIKNNSESSLNLKCRTTPDLQYLFNGMKNYQSNILEADILLFSSIVDNKYLGFFFTHLEINTIARGANLFENAMRESDTYQLFFNNLQLTNDFVLTVDLPENISLMHLYSRAWFGYLAMAPYLGGAVRAMEEGALFLNEVQNEAGVKLSKLDGFIVDYGRLQLMYQSSMDALSLFGYKLEELSLENFPKWIVENGIKSSAIKYQVSDQCEEIVKRIRRIVGGRSQFSDSILSKLTQEIVFGSLHPVINAKLEREFGSEYLNKFI